ncbi:hypothetical protein [Neisseria iguanae]|uniref:Lipoprotein n=1 Tax=Neisseria iguanae TaxID=90242 RepID=A0A2P7TXH7_9NEIS|nr:hypothetical protein [Neisseria iguanae]PSJ79427.1 hypothetical protein C7N83_12250 [Neisseria iguanae]
MKSFITSAVALSALSLSACVVPIDAITSNKGALIVPVPMRVPVVVKEPVLVKDRGPVLVADSKNSIYVCKIQAFTDTYRSEDVNRGRARLNVQKQCRARHNEMFCRNEDVKCTEYK